MLYTNCLYPCLLGCIGRPEPHFSVSPKCKLVGLILKEIGSYFVLVFYLSNFSFLTAESKDSDLAF